MEPLVVVMLHERGDDPFGLQIIITVIVVALVAYRAVEALDDAVRLRMSGPRFDIDEVMRFDHRGDVTIDELTAMIVYNARFDSATRAHRSDRPEPCLSTPSGCRHPLVLGVERKWGRRGKMLR